MTRIDTSCNQPERRLTYMKIISKHLAVLLAFIMIIGILPEKAQAASSPVLSMADDKILYLDGSKGVKAEDGSTCGISFKKKVTNMIVGYDFDKMSVSLKSSDTEIVRISKKEYIIAESIGKATVTVTVYNENKRKIFKKDLLVNVKKNADRVLYEGIKDNDVVRVGQTLEISLPRNGKDTDHRELIADKPELVEIKPTEAVNTWSVKFLKAGDVTFTGRAYQSSIYTGTTAQAQFKASIKELKLTDAEAIAPNAIKMTFNMNIKRSNYYTEVDYDNSCYYMDNGRKVYFSFSTSQKVSGENMWIYLNDSFTPGKTYYVEFKGSDPIAISVPKTEEDTPEEPATYVPYVPYTPPAPYPASICVTPSQSKLNINMNGLDSNGYIDTITFRAEIKDQYDNYFDIGFDKISWSQDDTSKSSFPIDPDLSFAPVGVGKYELNINPQFIASTDCQETTITLTTIADGHPDLRTDTSFKIKPAGISQNLSNDTIGFTNIGENVLDTAIGGKTYLERASLRLCSYNDGYYTGDVGFTLVTSEPTQSTVSTQSAISYALLIKKDDSVIDPANTPCLEVFESDGAADLYNFTPMPGSNFVQADTGEYTFTLYKISWDDSYTSASVSVLETIAVNVVNNQVYPTYTLITSRTTAEKAAAVDYSDCFAFSFAGQTYSINSGYEIQSDYGFGTADIKFVTKAMVPVEFDYYFSPIQEPVPLTFELPCTINEQIFING